MPNFQNPAHRTTAERLNRAVPFRVDERMEHLIEMREKDPAGYRQLPPSSVIAVGLYESDRATHNAINGGNAA